MTHSANTRTRRMPLALPMPLRIHRCPAGYTRGESPPVRDGTPTHHRPGQTPAPLKTDPLKTDPQETDPQEMDPQRTDLRRDEPPMPHLRSHSGLAYRRRDLTPATPGNPGNPHPQGRTPKGPTRETTPAESARGADAARRHPDGRIRGARHRGRDRDGHAGQGGRRNAMAPKFTHKGQTGKTQSGDRRRQRGRALERQTGKGQTR